MPPIWASIDKEDLLKMKQINLAVEYLDKRPDIA